jgi:hypothetical protein
MRPAALTVLHPFRYLSVRTQLTESQIRYHDETTLDSLSAASSPIIYTSRVDKRDVFFPLPPPSRAVTDNVEPVGILGAGVGGPYTALILKSLNVSYEIIEVRLYTHKFSMVDFTIILSVSIIYYYYTFT